MSLGILVAIVVVGIAAVVLAVHWTGGTRDAVLSGEAHARSRFAEDFPGEKVRSVLLTNPATAAFLELEGVRTGIVQAFGAHFLTRVVTPADIASVGRDGAATLVIGTRDFTWRGGRFTFADAEDADRVAARLSPANQNEQRKIA